MRCEGFFTLNTVIKIVNLAPALIGDKDSPRREQELVVFVLVGYAAR